jgi:ribulose 1,5-bisphosphate synthetase/thiazole synthase
VIPGWGKGDFTMDKDRWDVIVVGGGVSGVVAATAAARNGAETLLIEKDGSLGGTMTTCLVGPMMTFHSRSEQLIEGLPQEVVDRLKAMGASPGHILDTTGYVATVTPFDTESLKLVAQRLVLESGAELLLHALVVDVETDGEGISGVVVHSQGEQRRLEGQVIIDVTGDAHVAAKAGARCELGRPEDDLVQPVSLMFKVRGWDKESFTDYVVRHPEELRLSSQGVSPYKKEPLVAVAGFEETLQEAIEAGEIPGLHREHVLFFNTHRPDEVTVNMSRVTGVNPLDPEELTWAEVAAREQVFDIMAFLRQRIPGFRNASIVDVGQRVGIRESRRVVGEYMLTGKDVAEGRRFPDVIARSAYPIDIHALKPEEIDVKHAEFKDDFLSQGVTYEIPYRCLVPETVEGLLAAGRCMSTTVEAHGATRTSPSCMAFGQAAGTAAALAVENDVTPREVDVSELQETLIAQGANLGQ